MKKVNEGMSGSTVNQLETEVLIFYLKRSKTGCDSQLNEDKWAVAVLGKNIGGLPPLHHLGGNKG